MIKKTYKSKSPYEGNYFCFQINDFRKMDSIIVYMPSTEEKVRGVVTDVITESNEIVFNTSTENKLTTKMNNIVFLKEYDKTWLE